MEFEFPFMFKKCPEYKASTIVSLQYVEEFMNAIRSYKDDINSESLYWLLIREFQNVLRNDGAIRSAVNTLNKMSRDLYGDSQKWRKDVKDLENDLP